MNSSLPLSRRKFLGASALGVAAAMSGAEPVKAGPKPKIIGFTKPFQKLPFADAADIARTVGWDGVECPVRKGGAVAPERVEDELPKFQNALNKVGLELSVISTDIENATEPLTQRVLKTASALGIKRYRLKHYYYDLKQDLPAQLNTFRARLRDLAQLNRELNLQGSVQNHSGSNYFGAPVWDVYGVIRDMDPRYVGVFFDIGHAVVEGGYSWPIQARLIQPFVSVVSVKDFVWARGSKDNAGWRADWCPLGQGMVQKSFFHTLRQSEFSGPITQQFEYPMGDRPEMIAAMQRDLKLLKSWLGA